VIPDLKTSLHEEYSLVKRPRLQQLGLSTSGHYDHFKKAWDLKDGRERIVFRVTIFLAKLDTLADE